jgi:hypothetical protein
MQTRPIKQRASMAFITAVTAICSKEAMRMVIYALSA